ncbi:MAG: Dyp-type peroxidase [Gammaproteobacteria bacterium]
MSNSTGKSRMAISEFGDMQGLARFAHRHLVEACFVLLQVRDAPAARDWLRAAPVTSAVAAKPLPHTALQVAFTAAGLRALEVADSIVGDFSDEFLAGMTADNNRSNRLGDIGNNSPDKWDWGSEETPHILLMLYARAERLQAWVEEVEDDHFMSAFETRTRLHTTARGTHEPFGFADGISQPAIDWGGELSTDLHERDRYTNLLKAGEILLGYPNEYGLYTDRPLLDPRELPHANCLPLAADYPERRDLGRNGAYLVMRQLAQDVPGFWQFVDKETGGDRHEREQLASAMVGRERDGKPLAGLVPEPGVGPGAATAQNRFTFDDDPLGHRCPIGAHIRRANPRTGDFPPGTMGTIARLVRTLGFGRRHPTDDLVASSRFHRLLRRGRAYGPTLSPRDAVKPDARVAERGLYFICLGANILRQFEFVQEAWVMSSKFAGLAGETDPLLGNREPLLSGEPTDHFTLPQANAPARCVNGLPQFVSVRGGAYFFMPGLKALQFIATHPGGDGS